MKLNDEMMDLMSELEYLIGKNCYNPNSYDGWTGDEGCSFRYPVCYDDMDKEEHKVRYKLSNRINKENYHTMKYKFGSNHLYVGKGIKDVLEFLEERYNLDFNELEKQRKK